MSRTTARIASASALCVLGLSLFAGCAGQGKYTSEGVSVAEQKMGILKSGTEWKMAHQAFLAGDLEKALRRVDASLSINDSVTKSHVLRGRILLEMGDLGGALESLLTAATIDPVNPDAQYYLGIAYERLDEIELAADHYRSASELDSYNPSYAVAAAEMMIDLGQIEEAKTYLQSGPMFEHDAGVRQALGHIAMIQDDPELAVEMFEEASLLAPESFQVVEDLIRAQIAVGSFADAEQNIVRVLQDPDHRERRDLLHLRAQCLIATDRPVEARSIYQKLLKGEDGVSDVDSWIGLGNVAYVLDDERAMRRCASRVVAIAPDRPEGYSLWALWYRQDGDLAKALASSGRALEIDPGDASMHAFRGLVLSEIGRDGQALEAFQIAAELEPYNPGYRAMVQQASTGAFATAPADQGN